MLINKEHIHLKSTFKASVLPSIFWHLSGVISRGQWVKHNSPDFALLTTSPSSPEVLPAFPRPPLGPAKSALKPQGDGRATSSGFCGCWRRQGKQVIGGGADQAWTPYDKQKHWSMCSLIQKWVTVVPLQILAGGWLGLHPWGPAGHSWKKGDLGSLLWGNRIWLRRCELPHFKHKKEM